MEEETRKALYEKYPAEFVEHVMDSGTETTRHSRSEVIVNVSQIAKLLGDRRCLDAPIKKLLNDKDIFWHKNQRYLIVDKAYEVWKWRRLKQGKDIEEVENDARLIFINESDVAELDYPYSDDSYSVRFVVYHGILYLSVHDVMNFYNPIFEMVDDSLDYCFMRFTDKDDKTYTIMMMDEVALFKMFWDEGIFKPRFERWVRHEVRQEAGLNTINFPYPYQQGESFIEEYMKQFEEKYIYPLHIKTPDFMRWVDIEGKRWVSLVDFCTRAGCDWDLIAKYRNDSLCKYVFARKDDGSVEEMLVYEVDGLGTLIDSIDDEAKSFVDKAYETMFEIHPFFTGEQRVD